MIEIVLDTETTGLEVRDGHRIVEIGCIELDNLIPTGNNFHYYINPERKVSEQAIKIHGYTDQFLSNKKKFYEIADEFLNFIDNKKIIIHNAQFDLAHLNNELKKINKGEINSKYVVDTLDIARDKFPGSSINLDALCKRFRIDNSKREKHSALVDCYLLSKVYINLIDQKEPSLDFSEIKNKTKKNEEENIHTQYCDEVIEPSSVESELHNNFLKSNLKKNYFT